MKALKTLIACAAGLALVSAANAQTTYVRITGSTAFRAGVSSALYQLFGGSAASKWDAASNHTLASGNVYAYDTANNFTGSNYQIISGTVPGITGKVIVKTNWSGSVGGIIVVTTGTAIPFYGDSTTMSQTGANVASSGNLTDTTHTADIAMSDGFQTSTAYTDPALTDNQVGVVTFQWCGSVGTPFTNLTTQMAQVLFQNGQLSLAMFTGNHADEQSGSDNVIYALGRDDDSGTRLTALAECGLGALSGVFQWQPSISGTNVTSQQPWPTTTLYNGVVDISPNGGYVSGGGVSTALKANTSALGSKAYYVAYLGTGDSAGAIAGGAQALKWNGVDYSVAAVEEGQYTFWGYEHMLDNGLTADQQTLASDIAATIDSTTAIQSGVGLPLSAMQVFRGNDGGQVQQNY